MVGRVHKNEEELLLLLLLLLLQLIFDIVFVSNFYLQLLAAK
jgi:hypothetical protein